MREQNETTTPQEVWQLLRELIEMQKESERRLQETERLLKMEENLHKRIIGQEQAVSAVSQSIRRTRAGLKDPKRIENLTALEYKKKKWSIYHYQKAEFADQEANETDGPNDIVTKILSE